LPRSGFVAFSLRGAVGTASLLGFDGMLRLGAVAWRSAASVGVVAAKPSPVKVGTAVLGSRAGGGGGVLLGVCAGPKI
jgi:hypothetical protein